jgi:coproporphyrinogen III oxidase-like Fe-S oxidoreductase
MSTVDISLVEVDSVGDQTAPEQAEGKYSFAMEYLQQHGYEHYEISHFARAGHRSGVPVWTRPEP